MYRNIATVTLFTLLIASPTTVSANPGSQSIVQINPQESFTKGLNQYNSQIYSDAAILFSQASKAFARQGDKLNQALSLNYTSLAYQELGKLGDAEKAINLSKDLLQSTTGPEEYLRVRAQALNTLGRLKLSQGKTEDAVKIWQEAKNTYSKIQDNSGKIGTQMNIAQAFQALGFFRRAQRTLVNVKQDINNEKDPVLKITALLNLANASQVIGDLKLSSDQETSPLELLNEAEKVQEEAKKTNRQLLSKEIFAQIQLSKGNVRQGQFNVIHEQLKNSGNNVPEERQQQALKFYQQALDLYQKAENNSQKSSTRLQSQLNRLYLLVKKLPQVKSSLIYPQTEQLKQAKTSQAQTLSTQIQSFFEKEKDLSPSRNGIYARINFAQSLMKLAKKTDSAKTNSANDFISSQDACTSSHPVCIAVQVVVTAIEQAQNLQDSRAEAYALGTLGNLYEQTQKWNEAENFTNQALEISQSISAKDISSRWFWQLGRIKNAQAEQTKQAKQAKTEKEVKEAKKEAIIAYKQAVELFKDLQRDLVAMNRDVQFSFRNDVEPLYREYVRLLLEPYNTNNQPKANEISSTLDEARQTIESLQLAQIENFFRSACLDVTAVPLEKIGEIIQNTDENTGTTSIIYPIVLEDRIAIIASLPNQRQEKSLKQSKEKSPNLILRTRNIPEGMVDEQVDKLRRQLVIRSTYEFLPAARDLYNWIIEPIEADLEDSKPENLVFILDSKLQNIPIAALYDEKNQQYMIEKGYNLALSPSLELLPPRAPLQEGNFQAVIGGITKKLTLKEKITSPEGVTSIKEIAYPTLPGVDEELEIIKDILPVKRKYPDQDFNSRILEEGIISFPSPIVHLATHGEFSSRLEDTFILSWDQEQESSGEKLGINELRRILGGREPVQQKPIELLVLSACKTATGDDRAALGIAGIAIESGARSTLASLWSVNDEATTDLITQFYKKLTDKKEKTTKAEALRLAQMYIFSGKFNSELKSEQDSKQKRKVDPDIYKHPYYWAPFVLVGNWN